MNVADLAMAREKEAEAAGQILDKRLAKLRTAQDFVRFAKSRGASITSTKTSRIRISCNGVWHDVAGQGSGKDLMKSERIKTVISFKAMGIAFKSKS